MLACAVPGLLLALVSAIPQTPAPRSPTLREAQELWRLAPGPELRFGGAALRVLEGRAERLGVGPDGSLAFSGDGSRLSFEADAALGVTSAQSFTLELELRSDAGGFSTVLMCREGARVHYSIVMGRAPGRVAFEAWNWSRQRALSRRRVDDGAWHRLEASYDAASKSLALVVDGALEAVVPAGGAFAGSPKPALRVGDNLDPNVRQAYVGRVRALRMRRGLSAPFAEHLRRRAALQVLTPQEVDAQLEATLVRARAARPPRAPSAVAWRAQAARIRAGVQDALGLWPPPHSGRTRAGRACGEATDFSSYAPSLPLDVRYAGTLQREAYELTRVYWRSFEGYYASGWLYVPRGGTGKRPAVLCPHGHWGGGATHPVVQARCITLASRGYVVLAVDSVHLYDARFALTPLSLMTWNNLRGLELLRARADVDATRIGCTGASGGGQQSYYLSALDTGLAAIAPAVMACHFEEILSPQHVHCACNFVTHLLRVADMPQMAACFAPRPQFFLSVTGDWTKSFPERGFPEIAEIYGLSGARGAVSGQQWRSPHAYDRRMRNAMYAFFEKALRGVADAPAAIEAPGIRTEERATLEGLARRVPRDLGSVRREFRERLCAPRGAEPAELRRRFEELFAVAELGASAPERVRVVAGAEGLPAGARLELWRVRSPDGVDLPAWLAMPAVAGAEAARQVAVLVSPEGKARALVDERERISAYLARGIPVLCVDVRYVGELDRAQAWRAPYGRFLGMDEGILAVRDLLCVVRALPRIHRFAGACEVVGLGSCGASALFAAVLERSGAIESVVVPELGPMYRDADREPAISRIALHGDLDDAIRVLGEARVKRR